MNPTSGALCVAKEMGRRLRRSTAILRTPYWRLLFHDRMNVKTVRCTLPKINVLSRDGDWDILEVEGFHFSWHSSMGRRDLPSIYRDTFAPAEHNPHSFEYRRVRISPGDWVLDAGACEGFFTRYALQRGANVLAVEPIPILAEGLSRTFTSEIRNGRVKVIEGVLGNNNGTSTISFPKTAFYAGTTDAKWGEMTGWFADATQHKTTAYTLDTILERGFVPRLDFIKMDIENSELAAMAGATVLLRTAPPKLAIAVYHDYPNARDLRRLILNIRPDYQITYRGIFVRDSFGPPRPFMLYGVSTPNR